MSATSAVFSSSAPASARRVILLVLDSLGMGSAPDAADFGDAGADTLGHIVRQRAEQGDPIHLPKLAALGIGAAHALSAAQPDRNPPLLAKPAAYTGAYGLAREQGRGKDTPSGHWEIAGVPVRFDWGYFTEPPPQAGEKTGAKKNGCFPPALLGRLAREAQLPGFLGDCHASGTEIIARLGVEHCQSGKPIVYTSADSVFQIACHEETFGLERLYRLCELTRRVLDEGVNEWGTIGRVIARPFLGSQAEDFHRTHNRHDYSVLPPSPTLLVRLTEAGHTVIAIGKITDIYAQQGISKTVKAEGNPALFDATLTELRGAPAGSLVMTNFVDFDMKYGHRRDVVGYARALEYFDARLPELFTTMGEDDLLILTADHGCDPTWHGTDHTREYVPVLVYGKKLHPVSLGIRETFADIGQSVAKYLGIAPLSEGSAFL